MYVCACEPSQKNQVQVKNPNFALEAKKDIQVIF